MQDPVHCRTCNRKLCNELGDVPNGNGDCWSCAFDAKRLRIKGKIAILDWIRSPDDETQNTGAIMELITEDQSLNGATMRDNALRIWDDGFGPLWVYSETLGPVGVVRARTWEDAHEFAVDEIMDDGDMSDPDNQPEPDGTLPEGLHHRGGVPCNDGLVSNLAREDLNGSTLELLTAELAEGLEIEVQVS